MKATVTFREYELPKVDPETKEEERGEFIGSFDKKFEGKDAAEVNEKVEVFVAQYREETKLDVRVWEVKQ